MGRKPPQIIGVLIVFQRGIIGLQRFRRPLAQGFQLLLRLLQPPLAIFFFLFQLLSGLRRAAVNPV